MSRLSSFCRHIDTNCLRLGGLVASLSYSLHLHRHPYTTPTTVAHQIPQTLFAMKPFGAWLLAAVAGMAGVANALADTDTITWGGDNSRSGYQT